MTREELIKEYVKCVNDTPYALRTYLQTYDNTQSCYVPFVLFPEQKIMIDDYENYNDNIVLKYRLPPQHGFLKNYNLPLKKNRKKY